eukprot:TRINITY_DN4651_c0_g1_i1.p1 TRINITY_DN4651_c0_g1~~TRINITY_DN4651_c0_g1_i1.p1  ORF type:complete len:744 (-),score=195.84 TRINITY_DN4651_c0_g1_i1:63-2294(-)
MSSPPPNHKLSTSPPKSPVTSRSPSSGGEGLRSKLRFWEHIGIELLNFVPKSIPRIEVRSVFGWTDVTTNPEEDLEFQEDLKKSSTFSKQNQLPRLPIPDLKKTCEKYLRTLEPLLNEKEFEYSKSCVEEFLKEGGVGEILQRELQERDKEEPIRPSWLEGWWDDSYLYGRDAISINVNYFFVFEEDPNLSLKKNPDDEELSKVIQSRRAALLLRGALLFKRLLDKESLEPDAERNNPLDMSQYPRVFCATRIPEEERDRLVTYTRFKPEGGSLNSKTTEYVDTDPKHVVVMFRNQFYSVQVIAEDGKVSSTADIEQSFEEVKRLVRLTGDVCPPIGVLTAWKRKEWAQTRKKIIELDSSNEKVLEVIQSALVIVCLDDSTPQTAEETSRVMLHGPGTNRWFDKHNLIVCANGNAGMTFEHAVGDGTSTLRLADDMFKYCAKYGSQASKIASPPPRSHKVSVDRLSFRLNSKIEDDIETAYEHFRSSIALNDTATLNFERYGGQFMKDNNMSPDAYVQIALQLAYYKLFGEPGATYESASTKQFLHGRTETVRAVSNESVAFCKEAQAPLLARTHGKDQLKLLRDACNSHTSYMREAKEGRGVDRHLFGLRLLAECAQSQDKFPVPKIFTDPAYSKSSHWKLSTSHCGSLSLALFGFGPVVLDGFGIGYMIKNNTISFNITCKLQGGFSAPLFAASLEQSLLHMQAITLASPDKLSQPSNSLHFTHPTSTAEFHYVKHLQHYY